MADGCVVAVGLVTVPLHNVNLRSLLHVQPAHVMHQRLPLVSIGDGVFPICTRCNVSSLLPRLPTHGCKTQTIETPRKRSLLVERAHRGSESRAKHLEHNTSKGRLQHRQRYPHNDKSINLPPIHKDPSRADIIHIGLNDQ